MQRRAADIALIQEAVLNAPPVAGAVAVPETSAPFMESPALSAQDLAAEDDAFRGAAAKASGHEAAHAFGFFDGGLLLGSISLHRGPTGGCGGFARCFVERKSIHQRTAFFRAGLLGPIFDLMLEDRIVDGGPSRPSLQVAILESSKGGDLADARADLPSLTGANRRKRITREIRLAIQTLYRPRTRFVMYRLARELRIKGEVSGLMAYTLLNCAAAEWDAGLRTEVRA